MNKDALKQAIKALAIQDIYLRESQIKLAESYDPKFAPPDVTSQFRWGPTRASMLQLRDEGTGKDQTIWKVEYSTTIRFLKFIDPIPDDYKPSDQDVLGEIDATFIAEYAVIKEDISQEALNEFAHHNVGFHIWPYWREYVQSTCARTLLPRTMFPMHILQTS